MDGRRSPGGQALARVRVVPCRLVRGLRLAPAAAVALLAWACAGPPPAAPAAPITITVGYPQISQINLGQGLPTLARLIAYERLTANDAQGRTRPRLLERWTVAPDGLTWRLGLKPGVRFQDGSPMTVRDVVAAIDEDRRTPESSVCLGDITGVTAAGDSEVVIALRRRCYYLLDDIMNTVTRTDPRTKAVVATGPFSIASVSPNEAVLAVNPHYHGGRPSADRLVLRSFDTLRNGWAELMRGGLDVLAEVGPNSVDFLSDQSTVDLHPFVSAYANVLLLNVTKPVFRPPAVRRALNMAVDRMAIVQQAQRGHGVPATGPTWPRHWAFDAGRPGFSYDPAAAEFLLGSGEGTRAGGPVPARPALEFTCLVPENFAVIERMALLVQRQLAEVGVRMRIEGLPALEVNRRMGSGRFDAILVPFLSGPYAWLPYRIWHSPGSTRRWNFWGYASPAVDASLDAMRDAADDAAFVRAVRQFEAAFLDDPPAVLLTWNEQVQAVSHRFATPPEAGGRDAMHLIDRWSVRPPGRDEP